MFQESLRVPRFRPSLRTSTGEWVAQDIGLTQSGSILGRMLPRLVKDLRRHSVPCLLVAPFSAMRMQPQIRFAPKAADP
jgi:hypothetical protein